MKKLQKHILMFLEFLLTRGVTYYLSLFLIWGSLFSLVYYDWGSHFFGVVKIIRYTGIFQLIFYTLDIYDEHL